MGRKINQSFRKLFKHQGQAKISIVEKSKEGKPDIENLLKQEREVTRDLVHELKAFNDRMDSSLNVLLKALEYEDYETIRNTALSIKALEELGTCRMELYEYLISPRSYESMASQGVSIYKEVEKLYKSINGGWSDQARFFKLTGKSYSRFRTKRIISVGLFIIIENAWKYSHPDEPIMIDFKETNLTLELTITNWGPLIEESEIQQIYQRGYRGSEARKCDEIKGKGLGLDIAKRIFATCDVNFEIIPPDNKNIKMNEEIRYTPFTVKLIFTPMTQSYAVTFN